jgi:hypothetical protein
LKTEYRAGRRLIVPVAQMPLRRGLQAGLFFATFTSLVVLVRIIIAVVGFTLLGPRPAGDLGEVGRLLVFVIPGYFLGFSVAGVLFAAASHVRPRVLRYSLSGFLCGTSLYGAMGIGSDLMDGKSPNWIEIAGIAGSLGLLWGVLGFVMAVLDWRRERRRMQGAAV